jgi:shikimate dehydrogenase
MLDANTDLYCLIGHPVSKSLSPLIHNASFKKNNINAAYVVFDISEDRLKEAIDGIKALGIKGFNVTIPYKEKIMDFLDELSQEAKTIGAVNTVKNEEGKLIGYNTDGIGFLKSLEVRNVVLKDKKVVILGAGGASRAISMTLANEGVSEILILNRTIDKARKLANDVIKKFPNIMCTYSRIDDYKENNFQDTDIVVNCTSVGMFPYDDLMPIDPMLFPLKAIICDIVYKPLKTKFLEKASQLGCKTIGGIDMLIYQGVLSEEIWFNEKIDVENVKRMLLRRIFT